MCDYSYEHGQYSYEHGQFSSRLVEKPFLASLLFNQS